MSEMEKSQPAEKPEDEVSSETEAALDALLSSPKEKGEETTQRGGLRINISRYFRGEDAAKERVEALQKRGKAGGAFESDEEDESESGDQGGVPHFESSPETRPKQEALAETEASLNIVSLEALEHALKKQIKFLVLRLEIIERLKEAPTINSNDTKKLFSEKEAVIQRLETLRRRSDEVRKALEEISVMPLLTPVPGRWDFEIITRINHLLSQIKIRLYRKAIAKSEKDVKIIEDQLGSLRAEQTHLWSKWKEKQ